MPEPAPSGPIAIYGATGYTGRLIAAELARAGAEVVLSGRNPAKLEALAAQVGGDVRVQAVALDDAAGLRRLLDGCACVVAAAGPFQLHGAPVVEAAADTGTHYLDTTGEQPFMRRVFEEWGPRAAKSGAALITAMGFDYVPGDMIAALTAEGLDDVDELSIAYAVLGFGASRGTTLSALGMISGGDAEWHNRALVEADRSVRRPPVDFPERIGRQRMVRYPAGEHVTVPRHVPVRRVRTSITAATFAPPRMSALPGLVAPALQAALATPLRGAFDRLVARLPEGPPEERRRAARFTIVCDLRAGEVRRRGVISGRDVYGLTARSLAAGALRCARSGFDRSGALAPSEAFDPREFLAGLADFDVAWEVRDASP